MFSQNICTKLVLVYQKIKRGVYMVITMGLIVEFIKKSALSSSPLPINTHNLQVTPLKRAEVLTKHSQLSCECLYVVNCINRELSEKCQYVFLGQPGKEYDKYSYITVPSDTDIFELLNQINQIFDKLNNLEKTMLHYAFIDADVDKIINLGEKIFNNPITVYDFSLRVIATTSDINSHLVDIYDFPIISEQTYMSPKFADQLKESPLLNKVKEARHAFFFDRDDITQIICGIGNVENRIGFLFISLTQNNLSHNYFKLVEFMAFCIEQALKSSISDQNDKNSYIDRIIENTLTKGPAHSSYISYQLNRLGWLNNDDFMILAILPQNNKLLEPDLINHYRFILCKIFPNSLVAKVFNYITVILHNSDITDMSNSKMIYFKSFIEKNNLKCGCSLQFDNFSNFQSYLYQALWCVNVYVLKSPQSGSLIFYKNYLFEHIITEFINGHKASNFVLPSIKKIYSYDLKNNSGLMETLFIYLTSDRSYETCMRTLFISKSTMKRRIEKIKSIAGAECFNPDQRLNVLSSIHILKLVKKV